MALSHLKTKAKYKKMVARIGREDSIIHRLLLDSYFERKSEIEKNWDLRNGRNVILILILRNL